ncbi:MULTISPECIES: hypothetical protein [Mycobacterium]|uniref:Uncharacterized protein n=2 Tax=Mycobacterium TaxID=1763 RepID=A0A1X1TMY8_9MYCO|nr:MULTISPECIES: hypothetical protein [Mycobacterium]ORA07934.1 hypothetical protein BST14_25645 [Mycobacterium arosiense ATCC BAA-1401 = DSM 45069]ORV45942.1 hypothetical protein AWC00_05815 [Mycobacterium conspicuum]BBZ38789.1 hypothetical protein MCNS_18520 [Mycobacterium conspicuum]
MSLTHLPSAILTATLLLRLARLVRYRYYLRALIRTGLLSAAVAAGALLLAASGHAINAGPILGALPLSLH